VDTSVDEIDLCDVLRRASYVQEMFLLEGDGRGGLFRSRRPLRGSTRVLHLLLVHKVCGFSIDTPGPVDPLAPVFIRFDI
jgi:hypothetical protein